MSSTDGSDGVPGGPMTGTEDADQSVDSGAGGDSDRAAFGRVESTLDRLPLSHDRVLQALVGIVVVGLALRLLFLGDRVAHFDEGRVAYWAHYSMETGSFAYRRIIHGPLLQHLDRWLFGLVGANDVVMRLPVALIGAALPLAALLFRRHLRRVEVVALGALLAFNPVLLYYSRFMRSDLLVATFMFVALGFVVRYYDTRRSRYLYLASAATALGFGSKENAIVYVLVWVGAAALLADQALYRPRSYRSGVALLVAKGRALRGRLWETSDRWKRATLQWFGDAFWVVVIFVGVSLFVYAPRGAGIAGLQHPPPPPSEGAVGLWQAVGNPTLLPDLVAGTTDHTIDEFARWFGKASEPGCHKDNVIDGWLCFLGRFVEVMVTTAAPLSVFAIGGFLYERYGRVTSRNVVMFMTYAGAVSIVGYPLGTDIWGAWLTVHAIVPLAIPAAVGLSMVLYWGHEAFVEDDRVGVGIAAAIVLVLAALTGAVIVGSVYVNDQSDQNNLVQFAQPADDARPALEAMATISDRTEGPHLLVYHGTDDDAFDTRRAFVQQRESSFDRSGLALYPMCTRFHNALPLPWYIAAADVETTCERDRGDFLNRLEDDPPPVVLTQSLDQTVPRHRLEAEYVARTYRWRTNTRETTFWIHEDHADALSDR